MKVTVCLGSSCHLKGSRQVVEALQSLIVSHNLKDSVNLSGKFCLGECQKGVCVTIDGKLFSVNPENVHEIFETEILAKVNS